MARTRAASNPSGPRYERVGSVQGDRCLHDQGGRGGGRERGDRAGGDGQRRHELAEDHEAGHADEHPAQEAEHGDAATEALQSYAEATKEFDPRTDLLGGAR